ncbi:hypothetical protein CDAR_71631 [Caerostris darwini]|uniref:Uncharacterized protein n=1 Tax=Caerostris darwini TaxID=1538125 RepID=A0AAV4M6C1_9ARAC|nr:hypothetical protein CDAR_71631 [Caerostris darwini]
MCGESFWLEWLWFQFICRPVLRKRSRLHNLSNQRISRSMGHPIISRRHFGLLLFECPTLVRKHSNGNNLSVRAIQCLNCCNNAICFGDAMLWDK